MCTVVSLFKNAEHPWAMGTVVENVRSPPGDLMMEQGQQIWEVLVS